eukprot:gene7416-11739_t
MNFDFKYIDPNTGISIVPQKTTQKRKTCKQLFPEQTKKTKLDSFQTQLSLSQEQLKDYFQAEDNFLKYQMEQYEKKKTEDIDIYVQLAKEAERDEEEQILLLSDEKSSSSIQEEDILYFENNYINLKNLITPEEIEIHSLEGASFENYMDILNKINGFIYGNSTTITLKKENEIIATVQYFNNEIKHVNCSYCYSPFWCEHICASLMFTCNHLLKRESDNSGLFNFSAMKESISDFYKSGDLNTSDSTMLKNMTNQIFISFNKLYPKNPDLAIEVIKTLSDAIVHLGSQHSYHSEHYSVLDHLCIQWMNICGILQCHELENSVNRWIELTKDQPSPNFSVILELIQNPLEGEKLTQIYQDNFEVDLHDQIYSFMMKNESDYELLAQNAMIIYRFLESPETFGCIASGKIFESYFVNDSITLFLLFSKASLESMNNGNRDFVEELFEILNYILKFYPNIKSHTNMDEKMMNDISNWVSSKNEIIWDELFQYSKSLDSIDSKHILVEKIFPKLFEIIQNFLEE